MGIYGFQSNVEMYRDSDYIKFRLGSLVVNSHRMAASEQKRVAFMQQQRKARADEMTRLMDSIELHLKTNSGV